jgi:4-hydroxy-3-polyprenylbenzoate decarboxylase
MELMTIANALLGFGQCSLAKYLMIAAGEDNPALDINDIEAFFIHMLERVDWQRDLHFQTATTIDTLDYSGSGLNMGSKLVIAAAGERRRKPATELPAGMDLDLPRGFSRGGFVMPGVMIIGGKPFSGETDAASGENREMKGLEKHIPEKLASAAPLIVVADDPAFCAESLKNFLWVTFTRSNPSHDIYGSGSFNRHKHWGCTGPLIIDARIKPHHAPPLVDDAATVKRVDALAARGGPLHGII